MLLDIKHPTYHKDNHKYQQKYDRTPQSVGDHQPPVSLFSPCSNGCLALLYCHGSKTTFSMSDFRIMVTFLPSYSTDRAGSFETFRLPTPSLPRR